MLFLCVCLSIYHETQMMQSCLWNLNVVISQREDKAPINDKDRREINNTTTNNSWKKYNGPINKGW